MKTFFIKIVFISKKERKHTQISSVGAAVPRQVMKHAVRNPCKIRCKENQSAEGATENASVVPSALL